MAPSYRAYKIRYATWSSAGVDDYHSFVYGSVEVVRGIQSNEIYLSQHVLCFVYEYSTSSVSWYDNQSVFDHGGRGE